MQFNFLAEGVEDWIVHLAQDFVWWYEDTYLKNSEAIVFVKMETIDKEADFSYAAEVSYDPDMENYDLTIRIDETMTPADLIKSLAHEMTHVKQMEDGDLSKTEYKYKGTYYSFDKETQYFETPWEIEANGMERACLWRFANDREAKEVLIKSRYY